MGLMTFFRHLFCRHQFKLQYLKLTGIEPLPQPGKRDYKAWDKWHTQRLTHESETRRVSWSCCKCGKVFYAHCGLDISPKHGPIVADDRY